jgi:two-component system OmpR family sensor kinase
VLLVVVGDIIRRMFAPLRALAADVDARADDDLGAIEDGSLPAEIGPLVRAMNRLLGRVDLAMTAQRRFIADAAHELRTPLTALMLQAERLDAADMPGEARDRVAALRDGLGRGNALLEQLLALARIQQATVGDAPATPVDPVLRSVVATLMPLADRRSIDLGIVGDAGVAVPISGLDLSMLLRNLIDNAVRYTQPGGSVDVRVGSANGQSTIEVRDDGPGIPAAERAIVFEPFHRLAGDAEGSGLGLAIVKAIADRYRAEVAVADAGPGTRITITFPPPGR